MPLLWMTNPLNKLELVSFLSLSLWLILYFKKKIISQCQNPFTSLSFQLEDLQLENPYVKTCKSLQEVGPTDNSSKEMNQWGRAVKTGL